MNLDLSDEETAALTQELHDIVENDRYPVLAAHPHAQGHTRQDPAGAVSSSPVASNCIRTKQRFGQPLSLLNWLSAEDSQNGWQGAGK
jgi:hypothetical protein